MNAHYGDVVVLAPGCRVDFAFEGRGVTATVLAVAVKSQMHVSYQIAWFDGRNRLEAWVESVELTETASQPTLAIGFIWPAAH